jgi:SAM-dependent methyltransferase
LKNWRRHDCRLCGSTKLEEIVKLDAVPLPEYRRSAAAAITAPVCPLDLYMCGWCRHVQLRDFPESVFADYSYVSGQSKAMLDHFADMAKRIIAKHKPPAGSLIVDIGSNDGAFLRHFKDAGYRVVGVELDKELARKATESGIPTVGEPMSREAAERIVQEHGYASVVLAFNVFAHTDDLDGMTYGIRRLLDVRGVFVFEAQYLLDIYEKTLVATLVHEQLSHHSVKCLKMFLKRFHLEMFDVDRVDIQHGSIIGHVQHAIGDRSAVSDNVERLVALEDAAGLDDLSTWREFAKRVESLRARVSGQINDLKASGASIAAYGAARSGPSLISILGLQGCIDYIVDDDPTKVGRYSAGEATRVLPTAELLNRQPDYCLILAWVPADRIIAANQEYLRRGGKFVVLCPDFRIVEGMADVRMAA